MFSAGRCRSTVYASTLDKVEARHGIVSWDHNRDLFTILIRYLTDIDYFIENEILIFHNTRLTQNWSSDDRCKYCLYKSNSSLCSIIVNIAVISMIFIKYRSIIGTKLVSLSPTIRCILNFLNIIFSLVFMSIFRSPSKFVKFLRLSSHGRPFSRGTKRVKRTNHSVYQHTTLAKLVAQYRLV